MCIRLLFLVNNHDDMCMVVFNRQLSALVIIALSSPGDVSYISNDWGSKLSAKQRNIALMMCSKPPFELDQCVFGAASRRPLFRATAHSQIFTTITTQISAQVLQKKMSDFKKGQNIDQKLKIVQKNGLAFVPEGLQQ